MILAGESKTNITIKQQFVHVYLFNITTDSSTVKLAYRNKELIGTMKICNLYSEFLKKRIVN